MICKVVSVEDDQEIAELLRVVLSSPGIELYTADNGTAGLALIREHKPNLVVMDVMMPGEIDGWGAYDTIREDSALARIPIIMLSVLREQPERRRAFARSEIDLYLTKPFDTLHLRREVERMTGCQDLWEPPDPAMARASRRYDEGSDRLFARPRTEPVVPDETLQAAQGNAPDEIESPSAVLDVVQKASQLSQQDEIVGGVDQTDAEKSLPDDQS